MLNIEGEYFGFLFKIFYLVMVIINKYGYPTLDELAEARGVRVEDLKNTGKPIYICYDDQDTDEDVLRMAEEVKRRTGIDPMFAYVDEERKTLYGISDVYIPRNHS